MVKILKTEEPKNTFVGFSAEEEKHRIKEVFDSLKHYLQKFELIKENAAYSSQDPKKDERNTLTEH